VREDLEGAGEVEGVEVGVGGQEDFEGVGGGGLVGGGWVGGGALGFFGGGGWGAHFDASGGGI